MIERNKKMILLLIGLFVGANLIPIPFMIIFKTNDYIGISYIVLTLILLLIINVYASRRLVKTQRAKYYKEKERKGEQEQYIETRNILMIAFFVMLIVTIILCIFVLR